MFTAKVKFRHCWSCRPTQSGFNYMKRQPVKSREWSSFYCPLSQRWPSGYLRIRRESLPNWTPWCRGPEAGLRRSSRSHRPLRWPPQCPFHGQWSRNFSQGEIATRHSVYRQTENSCRTIGTAGSSEIKEQCLSCGNNYKLRAQYSMLTLISASDFILLAPELSATLDSDVRFLTITAEQKISNRRRSPTRRSKTKVTHLSAIFR